MRRERRDRPERRDRLVRAHPGAPVATPLHWDELRRRVVDALAETSRDSIV